MGVRHFLFALFFVYSIYSQGQTKRLFDYNDGLSNSLINQVFQDHQGFIWVATEDGLNRFDGIKFVQFLHNSESESSLKANFVTALAKDKYGNLWVGQVNGLQVYSHENESFEEIKFYINNERIYPFVSSIIESKNGDIWVSTSAYGLIKINSPEKRPRYSTRLNKQLCSFYLECLYQDKSGLLWIGSDNHGLNSYEPKSGKIQTYSVSGQDNYKIPGNDISSICEDDQGNIYIGSISGGLIKINKQTNQIETIKSSNPNEKKLPVKHILFDSKKRLWVGTDGLGLKLLNTKTNLLESYSPRSSTFDFSRSKIHSIIEDNAGNIWLGVFQKGLYLIPESPEIFVQYGYRAFGDNSIGSSSVTAIAGEQNSLWFGTDGDGIYHLNRATQKIDHILFQSNTGISEGNNVFSLFNSKGDFLWVGTYSDGLIRYNKRNGQTVFYENNPSDPQSLVNDKVSTIEKGIDGQLLIGTLGGGACRFDTEKNIFYKGLNISDSLNNAIPKWVNDVFIDKDGNYWIGTYDGLVYINRATGSFKILDKSNGQLSENLVYCIQQDSKGNIWVGTYNGLVKIEPKSLNSVFYSTKDGLANNTICAIQEDEHQELWLSTHGGLSRFNPNEGTFVNYYAYDGLQSNEFSRNTSFFSEENILFFGGINGVTEVKKDYRNYSRSVRDVMLTDFTRYDKPVKIGERSGKHVILNKSIVLADTVRLLEADNVFSIGFTSVELANQSRIAYEYMMEGFDKNWNVSNSRSRMATYTNLEHGTYTFLVRGVDKGQYSKARRLTIIIYPPWYKTTWATIFWILLLISLLYGIISFYRERVKRRETEKLTELKMQFFMNISHEIKTPLSLIIDPLDKLLSKKADEESNMLYQTMHRNASRIFRLINQLLDVRKIDKGQILVKYQKTNLYLFIKEVAKSYDYVAENRNIKYEIKVTEPAIEVWIDPFNFERVILNLLSNAFKFTPNDGKIEISISNILKKKNNEEHVEIAVSDSGIGLKKSELDKIFSRFYQVYSKDRGSNTGTGIGLHLSRSLVELHKGTLHAEIKYNEPGSRFVITLPLGNTHLPKEDLIIEENLLPVPTNKISYSPLSKGLQYPTHKHPSKSNYKIMVVEDEEEIRSYLKNVLSENYNVVDYRNGLEAFKAVLNDKPDLIVSDIMMPEMDGIEFCKKIKANPETNHTPIILLTALSKDEDRAQGIETGADMYLVKPFNSNFLKKTIASILENRRKIYEQLQSKTTEQPEVEIKSQDEMLVQKVMAVIKENISDSKLNVEMLADKIGISRVHLYRKLKELTNQTAHEFIKNIRMKQAAYLLASKRMNVSEVAYSVGFSNLSHFSNSFKQYYGVSPSEYVQMQHNDK